ncbi:hypothetical protein ACFP81_05595 [Deinococcus lacus]|uniref:Uncharacterized protein n=1 Tax=Deinococcus lacus TaxID=392561 RepID=A0ABW1YDI1_9DEIO
MTGPYGHPAPATDPTDTPAPMPERLPGNTDPLPISDPPANPDLPGMPEPSPTENPDMPGILPDPAPMPAM